VKFTGQEFDMAKKKKNHSQPDNLIELTSLEAVEEPVTEDVTATFEVLSDEGVADDLTESAEAEEVAATDQAADTSADSQANFQAEPPTIRSLGRLEEDLQRLQRTWGDVEKQLAARDAEISYLNDERDVHIAAFKSLQSDLDLQLDENEALADKIEAIEVKLSAAEQRVSAHDALVAERDQQIAALRGEAEHATANIAELQAECQKLRADIAARVAEQRAAQTDQAAAERRLAELKTEYQSLEAYIDGRKRDWDELSRQLDDYRDALVGMRDELEAREKVIAEHDKEKSKLNREIDSLRQHCAELDGRRAERELANKELNKLLGEKGSEAAQLRKERDDARIGSEAMVARMQDQRIRIHSLEHEVSELSCKLKEIRDTADREVADARNHARDEVSGYAKQLAETRDAIEQLTRQAEQTGKRLDEAQAEIKRSEQALATSREANQVLEKRLTDEAGRRSELSDELSASVAAHAQTREEFEAFQNRMEERLEANADLIAKLESELEVRNAAIELLETNADKLGAINENVKKLDQKIFKGVQSSERSAAMRGRTLMLTVDGMPNIRFPIYKPCMTIGRSSESDIRLRRKYISRLHARLTEDETGVRIEDLGSKNGLYINEQPVSESYLHDGDIVDIGEVKLCYLEDEQAA